MKNLNPPGASAETALQAALQNAVSGSLREVIRSVFREEFAALRQQLTDAAEEHRSDRSSRPSSEWMTVNEAASRANVAPKTVRGWIKNGLVAERPGSGRHYRIRRTSFDAFIERRASPTSPDPDDQVGKILLKRGEKTKG
jgi:excisionase family DNA binding protein